MDIKKILAEYYSLEKVDVEKLDGYENENFLVSEGKGKYVLKTYLYQAELYKIVQAERDVLLELKGEEMYSLPKPVQTNQGEFEFIYSVGNVRYIVRMLTYIEGEPFGATTATSRLYESFGTFLAQLDLLLMNIKNETIENRKSEWNIVNFDKNKKLLEYIEDKKDREILNQIFDDFENIVKPAIASLRFSIIHNDANDFNVLTKDGKITGIIDFGDLAYAPLIDELAVAIAYAGFGKKNPQKWAEIILKSYNKIIQLQQNELDVLYYMITCRLATTIVNAAYSRVANPENKYASTSEKDAWETLNRWMDLYAEKKTVSFG